MHSHEHAALKVHSRSRSQSPHGDEYPTKHSSLRARSRSPHRHDHHDHHRRKRRRHSKSPSQPIALPYKAKLLTKHHYDEYKPLFQSYLDIQKQLQLDELDEREVRGRWKSFVSRWNRGDLARSWYDPTMLKIAKDTVSSYRRPSPDRNLRDSPQRNSYRPTDQEPPGSPESEDDIGPAPPSHLSSSRAVGPTIPRMDDIELLNEQRREDRARDRSDYVDDIRHERKLDRKLQKERLEELAPRADPGSRERKLEKKGVTTRAMRDFGDAKEGGEVEMGESDLMGDDGDALKRQKLEMERKKSEREIRRDEIMRARAAEREERLAGHRAKEAQTMEYLKAIAKDRFG
ncbi:hypothetical protein BU24DRAFT_422419 [Aaosphaeria arxii CBS 175.79]|uniref:RNA helicase HEL117 n=1 Tax=Aaosphaeria arxii CBS 175.79 TaxID=1450172 RepID=A0A6A5XRY6_9PLEO|nr:uncharacterized protein BU24DRAFT_422419 [Aaosphaeria arxii CBS 175.79]KAF2016085.1 hypothetical protein BU24DRAFT_422419 [Aaosphaeria arxii CBS 175.79]